MHLMKSIIAALTLGAVGVCSSAQAANISGAGATFPYPVYAKWADAYKKETGVGLNYQSIGSGGGIKQITAGTVTFGASDAPLKPEQLQKAGLVQWPMIMGGIVPIVHLKGIKPGELVIDGPTLAKIYLSEIKNWNDPALKALNPKVTLPSTAIAVVHRSDGSGTTFNFTDYLSKISPEWRDKVGSATTVEWPAGVGAKGNEGVANQTTQIDGAIGYVEYAYAEQNHIAYMKMKNAAGKVVAPDMTSFGAAASNAQWAKAPGYYLILTNAPGDRSWPIAATSFILMPKQPKDAQAAKLALQFFDWAFKHGDKMAEALDYVPVPDNVVALIRKTWAQEIKSTSGEPVYTAAAAQ
jgi:phosphate transport system substrate-binding protein